MLLYFYIYLLFFKTEPAAPETEIAALVSVQSAPATKMAALVSVQSAPVLHRGKKDARHVDAEFGFVDWAFFSTKFSPIFLFEKGGTLETTLVSASFLARKGGLVAPLRPPWCIGRAHQKSRPAR